MRTRITFTDDASKPHALRLSATIVWYAYKRADGGLYLQRSVSGVLGSEILIATPVSELDAVVDPDDSRAWICFVTDGSLRCIEITDKTETPTTQAVQRNSGWYERLELHAGGVGLDSILGFPDPSSGSIRRDDGPLSIYPPSIYLFESTTPGTRAMLIQISTVRYGSILKFRVYKDEDPGGAGFQLYGEVPYPYGAPFVLVNVPAPVGAQRFVWAATVVGRPPISRESCFSNRVIETAQSPGSMSQGSGGAMGLDTRMTHTDRTPVKLALPTDSNPLSGGAMGLDTKWTQVDHTPIKLSLPQDSNQLSGGALGLDTRWVLDGIDILNP